MEGAAHAAGAPAAGSGMVGRKEVTSREPRQQKKKLAVVWPGCWSSATSKSGTPNARARQRRARPLSAVGRSGIRSSDRASLLCATRSRLPPLRRCAAAADSLFVAAAACRLPSLLVLLNPLKLGEFARRFTQATNTSLVAALPPRRLLPAFPSSAPPPTHSPFRYTPLGPSSW